MLAGKQHNRPVNKLVVTLGNLILLMLFIPFFTWLMHCYKTAFTVRAIAIPFPGPPPPDRVRAGVGNALLSSLSHSVHSLPFVAQKHCLLKDHRACGQSTAGS